MRSSFDWMKSLMRGGRGDLLTLFTPDAVRERSPVTRAVVAGATLWGILTAGLVGMASLAALLFAIAVIYFLATKVLGLRLDIDPQAVAQQFYRQTTRSSN